MLSRTQDNSELLPSLSKGTIVIFILRLIKCLSPSENDEQNSTFEVQHGTEHQFPSNYFQNKKSPNSNAIQTLKYKLEMAVNERLLTLSSKSVQSLENKE